MSKEDISDNISLVSSQPICQIHQEMLTLHCKIHETAICSKCTEDTHKNCDTLELKNEIYFKIEELSKLISSSSTLRDEVGENICGIEQNRRNIQETFKENIRNAFQKVISTMVEAVENQCNQESELLNEERHVFNNLIVDGEDCLQQLTEVQDQTNIKTTECLRKAEHIRQSLDRCSISLLDLSKKDHFIKNMNVTLTKQLNEAFWPANIAKFILMDEEKEEDITPHKNNQIAKEDEINQESMPSFSSFEIVDNLETIVGEKVGVGNSVTHLVTSGEQKSKDHDKNSEDQGGKKWKNPVSSTNHGKFIRVNGYRKTESYHCWLTGIEFLADDRLVAVDRNNNKLKLFSQEFDFIDSLTTLPSPFDVVQLANGEIAVSVPDQNKVYFYGVGEHLILPAYFVDVLQPCYGMATCNEDLMVFCASKFPSPPCIKIFNKNKDCTYRVIPRDHTYYLNMFSTRYIAADQTGNIYFKIGRVGSDEVICIDNAGKVVWRSLTRHWSHFPEGISVLHDDVVLASPQGHHVARLRECGHSWDTMYTLTGQFPTAIAFNKGKTKIAITNVVPIFFSVAENDSFDVFDVSP